MAIENLARRVDRLECISPPAGGALFVWWDGQSGVAPSAEEIDAARAAGRRVIRIQWVSASQDVANER